MPRDDQFAFRHPDDRGGRASADAYAAACASDLIPASRRVALDALYEFGPGTAREIGANLPPGDDRDITPRLNELRAQGQAEVVGTRACRVATGVKTERQVWAFRVGPVLKFKKPSRKAQKCWVFLSDDGCTVLDVVLGDSDPSHPGGPLWSQADLSWVVA